MAGVPRSGSQSAGDAVIRPGAARALLALRRVRLEHLGTHPLRALRARTRPLALQNRQSEWDRAARGHFSPSAGRGLGGGARARSGHSAPAHSPWVLACPRRGFVSGSGAPARAGVAELRKTLGFVQRRSRCSLRHKTGYFAQFGSLWLAGKGTQGVPLLPRARSALAASRRRSPTASATGAAPPYPRGGHPLSPRCGAAQHSPAALPRTRYAAHACGSGAGSSLLGGAVPLPLAAAPPLL